MPKFGQTVKYSESGKDYEAIVAAVKPGDVIDILFAKQVISGDGKPVNVVGSSRQGELVQFRHDLKPGEYQTVEDWFFSLTDEQLQVLGDEWRRRRQEKDQAAEAAAAAEAQKANDAIKEGVIIRPSEKVLKLAETLWINSLIEAGHAGDAEQIKLPGFDEKPELWTPWIEKAKQMAKGQGATGQSSAPSKPSGDSGAGGQIN